MKKNYGGRHNKLHASAMAIVDSTGRVLFAEATERYLQNKRSINCPPDFLQHVPHQAADPCAPALGDHQVRVLIAVLSDQLRSEDHTSVLQSHLNSVFHFLLKKQ